MDGKNWRKIKMDGKRSKKVTILRMSERKNKREVDSTAYERTEVLNKSLGT